MKKSTITSADILVTLRQQGCPMDVAALSLALHMPEKALAKKLQQMEREGFIAKNRRNAYLIPQQADLIAGRIQGKSQGYGYLLREDGEADVYLSPHEMSKVFHGDRVWARLSGRDPRGRLEGHIVEVIERAQTRLIGRIKLEQGVLFVQPEDRRIPRDILLDKSARKMSPPLADGQWVSVVLTRQPSDHQHPIGHVEEILQHSEEDLLVEIAVRKHLLPAQFSPTALAEAAALPEQVTDGDRAGREDMRQLAWITIDGEDARDFDDALWCEASPSGFRLLVAIADVSHYVRPGSALDHDAAERGTSVYFPRLVLPMLPEKISNGLCSLNPHVDRLALVCAMQISKTGAIESRRFMPAVIHSCARLTYTQAAAALAGKTSLDPALPLTPLFAVYQALLTARKKRGALDLDIVESKIVFDSAGRVDQLVPQIRNDAHRLVEECMLAANISAAEELEARKFPLLYRIHEAPSEEKLNRLREFLAASTLQLTGGANPAPSDFAALADAVSQRSDHQVIHTMMLRTMQQARYSPHNVGHFGLAYQAYTHFTSPIRRYPDLLVHRQLHSLIAHRPGQEIAWATLGQHCSMTERRADEASREVESRLRCLYMRRHLGETFDGTVSGVTSFGIFVSLVNLQVDGLVHISELGKDYFHYHEGRQQLAGERSGLIFRLGQMVRVQVVRADAESGKIDFVLVPA